MLDQTHRSEGKKGFGWIRVELRLDSVEGRVGDRVRMLDRGADKIDAVGTVLLQIEYELGREDVGKRLEDGGCFLIYLLDRSFDFMTVGIRSCMGDVSTEET
jgi:hypothetical protein